MKVYQNIKLNGDYLNEPTKDSKFYNEGKWNNFINPLLPEDCSDMTFVEVGSNVGLFLKMAKEKGFRNVVGVEKSRRSTLLATKYRDSLGLDYKLLNKSVDENFDFNLLPVADFTLMSNLHYHLLLSDFLPYLDRLKYKTRYALIVSAKITNRYWKASGEAKTIRKYFKEWKEVGYIPIKPTKGDPYPREMFAILFESNLKRIDVKDIFYNKNGKKTVIVNDAKSNRLSGLVCNNDSINPLETDFYKLYTPTWVDHQWRGHNLMGCPSGLTVKNKDLLFFDEGLNWYMDIDYYQKLYLKYGKPYILDEITVVNRTWGARLTDTIPQSLKDNELKIMIERYG